jgi:hypothetical protein
MVILRRTWHMHFDTDAEELLAGVQVGMVAGPRCRTHSCRGARPYPGLDLWRDSGCQESGRTHPPTIRGLSLHPSRPALRVAACGGRPRPAGPPWSATKPCLERHLGPGPAAPGRSPSKGYGSVSPGSSPSLGGSSRSCSRRHQPAECTPTPTTVGWRLLELLFDGTSPLAEVGPALVVDGDDGAGADQPAQLDGLPGVHAVAHRPGDREAHASQVGRAVSTWRRSATWRTPSYSTVSPVIHKVPCAWPSQPRAKPTTSPGGGATQRWAVAAGGGGDLDGGPSRRLEQGGGPWLEAAGVAAQPAGTGGGEDGASRREQGRPALSRLSPWWS